MSSRLLAAAVIVVAVAAVTGSASAGHASALQRVAISFPATNTDSFVLTPLASGPITRDSGSSTACCWSRRFFTRDGQNVEVDNPLKTFVGKRGTFSWRAQISFLNAGHGYYILDGTWKIVSGTGAYKHLTGHGRLAGINGPGDVDGATRAEGLLSLGG
jgi:hypothetical protein